jgi:hypothetical protein
MTTRTELAEIKRGIREQDAWRTVERRCYSIFTHLREKAKELKREGEIDFGVETVRSTAHDAMGKPCHWCEKKLTPKNFSFDHMTAVMRGGLFAWSNMMIVCSGCNTTKGSLSAEEFVLLKAFLLTLCDAARLDILRRMALGAKWRS